MTTNREKPSPEAKALSLFLMAFKKKDAAYKEKSKHINKKWSLVLSNEVSKEDYNKEVQDMLEEFGGYAEVLEKTVRFYIEETGEWKSQGDDKYAQDAKLVAERILKEK